MLFILTLLFPSLGIRHMARLSTVLLSMVLILLLRVEPETEWALSFPFFLPSSQCELCQYVPEVSAGSPSGPGDLFGILFKAFYSSSEVIGVSK